MTFGSILVVGAIVAVFLTFAGTLAWGDWCSRTANRLEDVPSRNHEE